MFGFSRFSFAWAKNARFVVVVFFCSSCFYWARSCVAGNQICHSFVLNAFSIAFGVWTTYIFAHHLSHSHVFADAHNRPNWSLGVIFITLIQTSDALFFSVSILVFRFASEDQVLFGFEKIWIWFFFWLWINDAWKWAAFGALQLIHGINKLAISMAIRNENSNLNCTLLLLAVGCRLISIFSAIQRLFWKGLLIHGKTRNDERPNWSTHTNRRTKNKDHHVLFK